MSQRLSHLSGLAFISLLLIFGCGRKPSVRIVEGGGCIHRFFDTSPVSPSGRYIALFRLPYEDKSPSAGDTGEVVVKDLRSGKTVYSELTRGWEMQLGANVQWGATDRELFFNDVDTVSWEAFAVKVDFKTGEKERCAGTVFMVSPDGGKLLSYDLRKSRFAQAGYGVIVPDSTVRRNIGPVGDDGVYLTDLKAGTCRMIVSIENIYENAVPSIRIPDPENYEYYCFQVKWNPQGTRLLTTVQWTPLEGGPRRRAVITMKADGSDIRTAITPDQWWKGGHHINWMPDGEHLSMNLNIDGVEGVEIVSVKYDGTDLEQLYPAGSGHPSLNPKGLPYIITDAYSGEIVCENGTTPIRLIDVAGQTESNLAEIQLPPIGNFELRVDAHPVWDRDGRHVIFNGVDNGHRCVYIAETPLCSAETAVCGATDSFRTISARIDRDAEYYGVSVGNGAIGIMPWNRPFSVRQVLLPNVYDENEEGISLSLSAINPFELSFRIDGEPVKADNMVQSLDLRRAVHSTCIEMEGKAEIRYDIRAMRSMPGVGIVEVGLKALDDISIFMEPTFKLPSGYSEPVYAQTLYKVDSQNCTVWRCSAETLERGVRVSAACAIVDAAGDHPHSFAMRAGQSERIWLIASVVTDGDFIDPANESDREVVFAFKEGVDRLVARHEALWEELWRGDIVIEGDDDAQDAARLALYHLYSFVREGSRQSISPMGLSAQGYNGHVFWDTEMWMYPPMLFLNRGIAESMIGYRSDRLPAARKKAYAYGYEGAMYPWESDGAGEESCPVWALTGPFEHHITADIAIAAWNFYRMYGDGEWLRREGWPMIKAIAEFWTSRVSGNADGSWSIRNVVCADEYAEGVDDNAFTNAAVKKALEAAVKAAKVVGEKADPMWKEIASGIRILRSDEGVTLEYEGYDGRRIKQADANLAAYPLGVITSPEDIRRDLEYYEGRINPKGPAMSYSMLALQYSRLGDGDKAYELFKRSYENNRLPPFGVLSECAGTTNPYFTTGAGGMLQCLINGFGGLELTDKGVKRVESALPSHWKSLTIKGVGKESQTWSK